MAKIDIPCPFTHRLCRECALYRGRHYYLGLGEQSQGATSKPTEEAKSGAPRQSADCQKLELVPWASAASEAETTLRIKLVDVETGETKVCRFEDAKRWDWSHPELVRVVGDLQITSWDKLAELLRYKAEKGYQEVTIYEFPRFMLIGGG